jgi:hypothetical protein
MRHPGRNPTGPIIEDQCDWDLMTEAYERLSTGRVAPELVAEFKQLLAEETNRWETMLIGQRGYAPPPPLAVSKRLSELEAIIRAAVPDSEVKRYLAEQHGYGTAERPIPEEFFWPWVS